MTAAVFSCTADGPLGHERDDEPIVIDASVPSRGDGAVVQEDGSDASARHNDDRGPTTSSDVEDASVASSVDAGLDGGEDLDGSASSSDGSTLPDAGTSNAYLWRLPAHFPRPRVPDDNPMTEAKVELGRHLFYDARLSKNGTMSCASCHKQALAFSDERARAVGSTGTQHPRSSMSLANVAYSQTLTWGNSLMVQLERQAIVPTFGDAPIELGNASISDVEQRVRAIARYAELFALAFPDVAEPVSLLNLNRALASFERTIISGNSAFDRYEFAAELGALGEAEKRGRVLVTTASDPRFKCSQCHGGFNLSDHVTWDGKPDQAPVYHQTGLYDLDGNGAYPEPNTGVYDVTQGDADMGTFKAPTLRNIALTAPYMHDGSVATLSDVLDHYAQGGRARNAKRTDPLLQPFVITAQEKADVIAFLESLTDESLIHEPRLSDPWPSADAGR